MGLLDGAGFGIGLQAKPKDYLDVYLKKDAAASAAKKADADELDKIAQGITIKSKTPLHRILQDEAKQKAVSTLNDIYQYRSTHPNMWKNYAQNRALELDNDIAKLGSLSENYRDLEKTKDEELTAPQREAKRLLQTGTSRADLANVGDVLGTVSMGQDNAINLNRKLTNVDIDKEVKDALGNENMMLQQQVSTKGGLRGNDYLVNTMKSQPRTDAEAAKVQADLQRQFPGQNIPVKSQESSLRDLFLTRPDIQTRYMEKYRDELVKDGKLVGVQRPEEINQFLVNKFVTDNIGKGGAKLSSSIQSIPKDSSGDKDSAGSAWVSGKSIGMTEAYNRASGEPAKKVPIKESTASDFLRFSKKRTEQYSPGYTFDIKSGRPEKVTGGKDYELEGVGKFNYITDKEGLPYVLTDEQLKSGKYSNDQIKQGWFGQALEKAGSKEGNEIDKPRMLPMTPELKNSLAKKEPLLNNISDSELFAPGSRAAATPAPAKTPPAPKVGQVLKGYKFKGGDPSDQKNWEKQ